MTDDDIEGRLRRAFAARADLAPPPGPVEQRTLTALGRGRQRRNRPSWLTSLRPVAVAASVLAVVGATAGGVTVVRDLTHGTGPRGAHAPTTHVTSPTPAPSTPTSPPSTTPRVLPPPPVTGSPPAGGGTTSSGPRTGPVPKGFAAADLTFVSAEKGWALGTTPTCAQAPCTSLLRTTDGGRHWHGIAPPVVDLATVRGCSSSRCVSGVRFADADVGYLFGPTTLYLTIDGGAHWSHQPGGAIALEIADGVVLRATTTTAGCTSGCTYTVQTSAVGSSAWRSVYRVSATGTTTSVELVRSNATAALQVYGFTDGGVRPVRSGLYVSSDDGATWSKRGDPCSASSAPVAAATAADVAVAPGGGSLTVLCQSAVGDQRFVTTSTDAGQTFVPGTANANLSAPIAAASAGVVFADVEATGQPSDQLLRSTDGGRTWAVVATAQESSTFGGYLLQFLGLESAKTGRWVSAFDPYAVWSTRDGGATWTRQPFQ